MWISQNESPIGYEPVYSVKEKETGRDIALNLEKEEANIIANSKDTYKLLIDLREVMDDLYINCKSTDETFLKRVNMLIGLMDHQISKIER